MILPLIVLFAAAFSPFSSAASGICQRWSEPYRVGKLDRDYIPEQSGLAASGAFPDRLYHVNDSGDGAYFYQTNMKGEDTRRIEVKGFTPKDVEDVAVGPCGKSQCLFLADIGDNKAKREQVRIALVSEEEEFPDTVTARRVVVARYPDRAHNAEAIVVHPSGDLFLITKEFSEKTGKIGAALVFRLSRNQIESGREVVFQEVGEIDLPWLNDKYSVYGQMVTGAAFRNGHLLLLTYENAVELKINLEAATLPSVRELNEKNLVSIAPILDLNPQQESITYVTGANSFLFGSETKTDEDAALRRVDCLD